ncbi:MAG: AtpZ/AtpI family protein [bacterium]
MMDIAFSLVVPVILGFFLGHYLDVKYSNKFPLWTVVFILIGIITGLWSVYKNYISKK